MRASGRTNKMIAQIVETVLNSWGENIIVACGSLQNANDIMRRIRTRLEGKVITTNTSKKLTFLANGKTITVCSRITMQNLFALRKVVVFKDHYYMETAPIRELDEVYHFETTRSVNE